MPQYTQFPSTYPYNTLNPQIFNQQFTPSAPQPATSYPPAGLYAPIPVVGQPQPGVQMLKNESTAPPPPHSNITVEIPQIPMNREGVYMDDTRNVKRPKLAPAPIAPKLKVEKVHTY
jgi:hypothetical protein